MAKTYVIAPRRTGADRGAATERLETTLAAAASRLGPAAPPMPGARAATTTLVEMEEEDAAEMRRELGGSALVEELIEYRLLSDPGFDPMPAYDLMKVTSLDLMPMVRQEPLHRDRGARDGTGFRITVLGRTRSLVPLEGAEVHVFVAGPGRVRERILARTDPDGVATVDLDPYLDVLSVIAVPYSGFWPTVARGSTPSRSLRIVCEGLPRAARDAWWHEAVGGDGTVSAGHDLRVGVIDSGCGPNPALDHVISGGAFVHGQSFPDGGADSGAHGTHVCGTIGARIEGTDVPFAGLAPGVRLHSARVFPQDGFANQGDIADAIDHMVEEFGVDLINMSLGAPVASAVLGDAIDAAFARGVICICAAGNDAGPVSHPAAHPRTVAVGAFGRLGFVPAQSLPALPQDPRLFTHDRYHAADFSNFGPELDLVAPGVGIIAPVPARFAVAAPFSAMNGTSMAAPIACAALAIMLSRDGRYRALPRDRSRSRHARMVLQAMCEGLGLPDAHQGAGRPVLKEWTGT